MPESVTRLSFCFSGDKPSWSCLEFLRKVTSFLLSQALLLSLSPRSPSRYKLYDALILCLISFHSFKNLTHVSWAQVSLYTVNMIALADHTPYSRTSMARTPLGP